MRPRAGTSMADDRRLEELTVAESLLLLGSVPVGRVVFTHRALPAIRPVSHLLAADRIIFRASLGAAITAAAGDEDGTVVAFEADQIDAASRIGWSVVVVGRACRVTCGAEADHYRQALHPWAPGPMDDIIAIRTDLVTGLRLAPSQTAA